MNYLAHALLSPDDEHIFLGNFSGDFVKGSKNPGYDVKIWQGVLLHRQIDSWTDSHELVIQSKKLISPARRRFAGVILDMAYDHFLSNNWNQFCNVSRKSYIQNRYQQLNSNLPKLPSRFLPVVKHLMEYDWLGSYHSITGLEQSLEGIGRRFQIKTGRVNTLSGSIEEILNHQNELESLFIEFFPQIQKHISP